MKLTPKQKIFCDEYLVDLNATRAYKAVYSNIKKDSTARTNGSRLLTNANVKEYIDEKLKQLEDKRIAKAEEVLQYLTKVMRGEETEQVVVTENIGDFMSEARVVEKQVGAKERNKAAELLGKRYRLFTEKVEVEGNVGIEIVDDIDE